MQKGDMDIINDYMFAELVAMQQESGLNIREFCKQEKMSISKLYSLRGKFRSRIPKAEFPLESIGFAPIHIASSPELTSESSLEIILNKGDGSDILPVYVTSDGEIAPKCEGDMLDGYDIDTIYCLGCS